MADLRPTKEGGSAYVEWYEPTHPDEPSPPGAFAMCGECGWDGPYRDATVDAQKDADAHRCPS